MESSLTPDMLRKIALSLDRDSLLNLSRTNKAINDMLYRNPRFWAEKIKRDYPDAIIPTNVLQNLNHDPKLLYEYLSDLNSEFLKVDELPANKDMRDAVLSGGEVRNGIIYWNFDVEADFDTIFDEYVLNEGQHVALPVSFRHIHSYDDSMHDFYKFLETKGYSTCCAGLGDGNLGLPFDIYEKLYNRVKYPVTLKDSLAKHTVNIYDPQGSYVMSGSDFYAYMKSIPHKSASEVCTC